MMNKTVKHRLQELERRVRSETGSVFHIRVVYVSSPDDAETTLKTLEESEHVRERREAE
jgi:hypothetical protein